MGWKKMKKRTQARLQRTWRHLIAALDFYSFESAFCSEGAKTNPIQIADAFTHTSDNPAG
jgi:hypothetical protein